MTALTRLDPKISTAMEVAVLAQAIPIEQAAQLIEQYAHTVATGAKLDATQAAYDKMDHLFRQAMEAPLAGQTEYEATLRDVAEEMAHG